MDSVGNRSLLEISELVIQKSTRGRFFTEFAIANSRYKTRGYVTMAGNKALLMLHACSGGLFFPSRPMEVRDQDGQPVMWLEFSGIVRRLVVTVRHPDGRMLGRFVGRAWKVSFRNAGYWIEIDGDRAGEIIVEKRDCRLVDAADSEFARIEKRGGERIGGWASSVYTPRRTFLHTQQSLAESRAALALAAAIARHWSA
jgi:hypothetical protein